MFSAVLQIPDIRRRAPSGQPQIKLIDDLKAAIESGRSIQEAAEFLCRADRGASQYAPDR
jgi:hypothetical protein